MKRLRAQLSLMPQSHNEFVKCARMAFTQANRLANDPPFNAEPTIPSLAVRLYCEAIYWSLAALAHRREGLDETFIAPQSILEGIDRAGVNLTEGLDVQAATALSTLLARFERGALAEFPALDPVVEQELVNSARRLFESADEAARGIESIWFARLLRAVVPPLLIVCLAFGATLICDWREMSEETTFPWRASSTHTDPGCRSPRQGCEQDHFFFHTRFEKDPWIEFDVREIKTVSQVTIINRTDCPDCSTRATPLVIELAGKDRIFKTVAKREADFVQWSAKFPRTQAQWLRLRAEKRTHLHLKQVRIEP